MPLPEFTSPVAELIQARSSWRSYTSQLLSADERRHILSYLAGQSNGPLGSSVRFQLIEKDDPSRFDNTRLGTYGFIKNARTFIAGAVTTSNRHWEDYGYLLEKIILKMTDLELGTCWLGGTFKRSEFGPLIGIGENEVIPAVTPVGHGTIRRSLRDRLIRRGAQSRTRRPWDLLFFADDFDRPLSKAAAGNFALPLEMVRLAPSASNRQPWRTIQTGNAVNFYLRRSRKYSELIKAADLQRVDMGIAMCHFELTAREINLDGRWVDQQPDIFVPEECKYIITWNGSNAGKK